MASDFTLTTILIVVLGSVWCEQRPFLRYSNYLKKALPYHWQYDQEKLGKSVDKITRWHQVEELRNDQYHGELRPHLSPLRPRPDSFQQWKKWAKQGILAAVVGNKDKELLKVRAQLLQEKLSPNHHVFKKTEVHPQEKPKFKAKEKRFKRHIRAAVINKLEDFEKEPLSGSILRPKRQVVINPQLQPETVMQPHIQIAIPPEPNDKQKNAFPDKRGKRQILYIINRPSQLLYRSPRTTPNPFIRETNIGDYDIGRQDLEGSLPDLGSSRLDSYPLISESSDLEYESQYTISMSDSEDWYNFPLTTPSCPNPGWHLSTLANIYQKSKRKNVPQNQKPIFNMWLQNQRLTREKRSPKEKKPKIGAYKEKLKQRRKRKEIRLRRRIIRNSKEDKEVKEDLKDDKAIESLLQRQLQLKKPRMASYQKEQSEEILWSNGTHRLVEDVGASFHWINKTHYEIHKENASEEWFNKYHVLVCDKEYLRNHTKIEEAKEKEQNTKLKPEEGEEDYSEDYDEDFTEEEEKDSKKVEKIRASKEKKKVKKKEMRTETNINSHVDIDNIETKKHIDKKIKIKKKVVDIIKKRKVKSKRKESTQKSDESKEKITEGKIKKKKKIPKYKVESETNNVDKKNWDKKESRKEKSAGELVVDEKKKLKKKIKVDKILLNKENDEKEKKRKRNNSDKADKHDDKEKNKNLHKEIRLTRKIKKYRETETMRSKTEQNKKDQKDKHLKNELLEKDVSLDKKEKIKKKRKEHKGSDIDKNKIDEGDKQIKKKDQGKIPKRKKKLKKIENSEIDYDDPRSESNKESKSTTGKKNIVKGDKNIKNRKNCDKKIDKIDEDKKREKRHINKDKKGKKYVKGKENKNSRKNKQRKKCNTEQVETVEKIEMRDNYEDSTENDSDYDDSNFDTEESQANESNVYDASYQNVESSSKEKLGWEDQIVTSDSNNSNNSKD